MPSEFILKARPGYDAVAVASNPSSKNSDIFEFDDDGTLRAVYPTNPRTLHMLKPVMPPSFYRTERVMKKFSLDRELPEGKLASGCAPHIQLVWKTVSDGVATIEDVFRSLASDWRIVPNDKSGFELVRGVVGWMSRTGGPAYLIHVKGKLQVGVPPKCDPPLIELHRGYDPIEWEIYELARRRGMVSYAEMRRYIVEILGWLSDEDYLKDLLKDMVGRGNLEPLGGELYRSGRVIEPFK